MKKFLVPIVAGLVSFSTAVLQSADRPPRLSGPGFAPPASSKPELGPSAEIELPPAPALLPESTANQPAASQIVPPAPARDVKPETKSNPVAIPPVPTNGGRQSEAANDIVQAQELINQGRYEDAVRAASRAIALDPDNASDFKKIRASAYLALGGFEQALADSSPLEVTVTAPRAELKTKQTVLGVVAGGTTVMIDDVKGNWLKVASVGDKKYDWAWIHQRDVQPGAQPATAAPQAQQEPQRIEYNPPSYAPVPPQPIARGPIIYYGPGRPYYQGAYGREYYNWQQHVPMQYWGFLPY